jgi:hypothetical protein
MAGTAARTGYGLDIDAFRKPFQRLRIGIDNHHILVLQRQTAGDVKPHFTGTDNDYFHRNTPY